MFDELLDRPQAILDRVWELLAQAPADVNHPWRLPVLGTVDEAGCDVRTLVFREFDPARRTLFCHTDVRSPKVEQIRQSPRGAWHFYDPTRRVQIRIAGPLQLHHGDPLARQRWEAVPLEQRRQYLAPAAPGAVQPGPFVNLPEHLRDRLPTLEESEAGWPNFCVLTGGVERLDWYFLRATGHLRLQVRWPDDEPVFEWLAS